MQPGCESRRGSQRPADMLNQEEQCSQGGQARASQGEGPCCSQNVEDEWSQPDKRGPCPKHHWRKGEDQRGESVSPFPQWQIYLPIYPSPDTGDISPGKINTLFPSSQLQTSAEAWGSENTQVRE